jgi:hypothetical protein
MSQYIPKPVPADIAQLPAFLKLELESLSAALVQPDEFQLLQKRYTAPARPREGMLVLADGTSWNPGSGAGFYGYRGTSWVFLG